MLEKHPEETQRVGQDLMDFNSTSSKQPLLSYLALLFSNDLGNDSELMKFLAKAEELNQLKYLRPLFSQRSPSARAVVTRLLHAAIASYKTDFNTTKFLSQALENGADLESPSTREPSMTLLQRALKSGEFEVAQLLIDAGANVSVGGLARGTCSDPEFHVESAMLCPCQMKGMRSPIALAARSFRCASLLPKLIEKGAIFPKHSPVLSSAISFNASAEVVSCLIRAGTDIDQCASKYNRDEALTPMSTAAREASLEIVQLLLQAGANPNGPLRTKHRDVFELIGSSMEQEERGNVLASQIPSPLSCAIERSRFPKERNDSHGIVRLLLEFGANPNISALDFIHDEYGWLSEEVVASSYEISFQNRLLILYPIQVAVKHGDIEIVKLLLRHEASVNPLYGTPPLAVAASHANIEIVRLLLSQNADPNGLGNHHYCQSALEAAVETKDLDLIDLLLAAGADINKCSASHGGRTPL